MSAPWECELLGPDGATIDHVQITPGDDASDLGDVAEQAAEVFFARHEYPEEQRIRLSQGGGAATFMVRTVLDVSFHVARMEET